MEACFSDEELKQATNNYDARLVIVHNELYWKWYKGSLDSRLVSIRKFEGGVHITEGRELSNYVNNDQVISAKMSTHNIVLTLIGCCLETRPPTLVNEFAVNGSLANQIQGSRGSQQHQPLAWASRLKIAREIAHVISFLWYMLPEYFATGKVTEKADVYSFVGLLLELVIGQNSNDFTQLNNGECVDSSKPKKECIGLVVCMQNGAQVRCIVDPTILAREGRASTIEQQLQVVVDLAFTCRKRDSEIRATMVDVTKERMWIERLAL
ncbi:serine/threonine-protein kinase ZRK1-like [Quercus robur]|uniref:serine/threonine-protein kinase ZRK1-like n=1 Tax=Quercus robur TaxID=38942 RepID=UPI0021624746|nr:serine/threonine-protein kinase ZRK1-like [Quercus robur]